MKSVSGIHIFPRSLWDEGARYGVYDDTNKGTEITYFCEKTGGCVIDLNAFFYREKKYPLLKCIQCSIGLRKRLKLGKF